MWLEVFGGRFWGTRVARSDAVRDQFRGVAEIGRCRSSSNVIAESALPSGMTFHNAAECTLGSNDDRESLF